EIRGYAVPDFFAAFFRLASTVLLPLLITGRAGGWAEPAEAPDGPGGGRPGLRGVSAPAGAAAGTRR
ncbi:MAG TPA: hypothetical protein VH642_05545, partial [Streptosporangiaceae bacterium]